jgi:G3E family GTPase
VVQTLASDTLLAAQFRLDGLVTLVDGAQALQQLAAHGEPAKQIALADRIFITKADLVDEAQRQAVEQAVRALNPRAPVSTLLHGEVDPAELTGLGLASARASPATLSFLGEPLAGEGTAGERHLGQRPVLHDASIRTLSLRFETPFAWPAFSAAMELLTTLRGPDLLRVKGIVNVEGRPVVVQGVQHIFHDPVELDRWPSANTGTRLVFITRGIDAATIRNLLNAVAAANPASSPASNPGR